MKLENILKIGAVSIGLVILLQGCGILFAPGRIYQGNQEKHYEEVSRVVQEDYSVRA